MGSKCKGNVKTLFSSSTFLPSVCETGLSSESSKISVSGVTSISGDFGLVWHGVLKEWLKIDGAPWKQRYVRERGKANTWASLRFVAPLIGECSEDITASQPNRSFLSPSLSLSGTYFLSRSLWLSLLQHPPPGTRPPAAFPPRHLPARIVGDKYLYKSVTGACRLTAGGNGLRLYRS